MAETSLQTACAIDCHTHVLDPLIYPYVKGSGYQPRDDEAGTGTQLRALLRAHGLTGALLVQPSCYGTDNRAMLAAVAQAPASLRAIAVVAQDCGASELHELANAGVVGIRLNAVNMGEQAIANAGPLCARVAELGWVLQLQCPAERLQALLPPVLASGASVILDHLGYPSIADGARDPAFAAVLALADMPRVHVKLSGAFRLSKQPWPHGDVDPFVSDLLAAFGPERCVWGSDWPFIGVASRPSYQQTLALARRWLPDPRAFEQVFDHTPARLFGFAIPAPQ